MTTVLNFTKTGQMILGCHLYTTEDTKTPACAFFDHGKPVIAINENLFSKFSETDQQVILYHECGHIKNAHKDDLDDIQSEYVADAFAAIYLGKNAVIDALQNTINLILSKNPLDSLKVEPLQMRIEHLLSS